MPNRCRLYLPTPLQGLGRAEVRQHFGWDCYPRGKEKKIVHTGVWVANNLVILRVYSKVEWR